MMSHFHDFFYLSKSGEIIKVYRHVGAIEWKGSKVVLYGNNYGEVVAMVNLTSGQRLERDDQYRSSGGDVIIELPPN